MTLAEIPNPLVLFDGECAMCNRWVVWVLNRDTRAALYFTSNRSELAHKLLDQFDIRGDQASTVLVYDGTKIYRRSDAVLFVLKTLPAPYSWLQVLRLVPRFVRDWVYGCVALVRYRVFGRVSECALLSEDQRKRLV
jgi:predicted DCC family thiol-disulfide oxidoreductase YuxK